MAANGFLDSFDLVGDSCIIPVFQPADIEYHIDFICASFNGILCFEYLGSTGHGTKRESNHHTDVDITACKFFSGCFNPAWIDAYRCKIVFFCLFAQLNDLFFGCVRLEQSVIDILTSIHGR